MRAHAILVWLWFALLLICASACASSKPSGRSSTSSGGVVTGTLRLVGGPPPGADEPASGEVYAFTTAALTGKPVAKVKAGKNGSFRLHLPAGTYYLAATSPSFSIDPPPPRPPCSATAPVVVTRGSTGRVDVICEMK